MSSSLPEPDAPSATSPVELARPTPDVVDESAAERSALQSRIQSLLNQGRNGANWFYWTAGLSLVNSLIHVIGGGVNFIVGLGVTFLADLYAAGVAQKWPELATSAKAAAFGFAVIVTVIVAGFGWFARKRYLAVYVLGMILYLLDGLLFLLIRDWLSIAFHAYALFSMWLGLKAFWELRSLEIALANQPEGPAETA